MYRQDDIRVLQRSGLIFIKSIVIWMIHNEPFVVDQFIDDYLISVETDDRDCVKWANKYVEGALALRYDGHVLDR